MLIAFPTTLSNTLSSLLAGLVSYYSFASGSFLIDSTGSSVNSLTNNGVVTQSGSGIIGNCTSFVAASSQYLSVVDNPLLHFSSQLSIGGWFNFNSVGSVMNLIAKGILSSTLEFALQSSASIPQFFIGSTTGAISGYETSTPFTTGTWFHLVVVYDGSQSGNANRLKMWLNGVSQTLTFSGTIPATNTSSTDPLYIGALNSGSSMIQFMDGLMDEIAIANVAWTSAQVAALYGSGTPPSYPFLGIP